MTKREWINPNSIPMTGWPPGLLQDDSSELSHWLSSRGNAKQLVDEKVGEMTEKHTPGPWGVNPNRPSEVRQMDEHGVARLQLVVDTTTYNVMVPWRANAHLIAAAPDLLEFAEEVRHSGDTRLASMAIAVINKATKDQS